LYKSWGKLDWAGERPKLAVRAVVPLKLPLDGQQGQKLDADPLPEVFGRVVLYSTSLPDSSVLQRVLPALEVMQDHAVEAAAFLKALANDQRLLALCCLIDVLYLWARSMSACR